MWFHYSIIQNGLKEKWKQQTLQHREFIYFFGKKDRACTIMAEYENNQECS